MTAQFYLMVYAADELDTAIRLNAGVITGRYDRPPGAAENGLGTNRSAVNAASFK